MTRESWNLTRTLLNILKRLNKHVDELDRLGIKLLTVETEICELIHGILLIHGIAKSDDAVAWLAEPILSFIDGQGDTTRCLKALDARLIQLGQQRAVGAEAARVAVCT